jgi:hypothetical protein
MKKNILSRFVNAFHLVVGQDCFDVIAQNHHVDIWVHSLFVPTNLTSTTHLLPHLQVLLAFVHICIGAKLPL